MLGKSAAVRCKVNGVLLVLGVVKFTRSVACAVALATAEVVLSVAA